MGGCSDWWGGQGTLWWHTLERQQQQTQLWVNPIKQSVGSAEGQKHVFHTCQTQFEAATVIKGRDA